MRSTLTRWAVGLLALAAVLPGVSACQTGNTGKAEAIAIGTAPLESSALIYIADNQGLFASNRMDLLLRDYETGAAALNGLVNGEIDIAVPAEYAVVARAFNKDKTRALASIAKAQYFDLVASRDRGIASMTDLKGKKVGAVRKTIAEFYLGRLLELHGMTAGQVTVVDVNVAQSEEAIGSGDVDAIISRPPYISFHCLSTNRSSSRWKTRRGG